MRWIRLLAPALLLLSGCVVHEYGPPPPPNCRAVWVEPHYDAYGYWHPGHWRCV